MGTLKTASVRWFLGQTVLPEHLQALHDTAHALCEQRARLAGWPHYGVAELTWSEPLLPMASCRSAARRRYFPMAKSSPFPRTQS